MSHSSEPDEQNQPSDVEVRISLGAIALGLVFGYVSSSILLGVIVWFLFTILGLELYKAISKVGLKQALWELAEHIYLRLKKELDSDSSQSLSTCRTCLGSWYPIRSAFEIT